MIAGSIARRYAKALLLIGIDGRNYDALAAEIESLARTVAGSTELSDVLSNPVFPQSQRRAVLEDVAGRLGLSPVMLNFVRLLVDRSRIAAIGGIAREYRTLVDAQAGRVRAVVTSARPLSVEQEVRIKAALEKQTGKHVIVDMRHDPALLGGVVAQIGDIVYDGSVRSQLAGMREQLLAE